MAGANQSKHAETTNTGSVNSNFIIEENSVKIPLDIKILLYVAAGGIMYLVIEHIRSAYRRSLKRQLGRSIVLRNEMAPVTGDQIV